MGASPPSGPSRTSPATLPPFPHPHGVLKSPPDLRESAGRTPCPSCPPPSRLAERCQVGFTGRPGTEGAGSPPSSPLSPRPGTEWLLTNGANRLRKPWGFSHSNGCRLRDSHRSPRLQERSAAWSGWCFWGVNICLHPRGCTLALGPPLRLLPGLEASPERGAWGPLAGTRVQMCASPVRPQGAAAADAQARPGGVRVSVTRGS